MPTATDYSIEEICDKIRRLCSCPLSAESEVELRRLARRLRLAIAQHVAIARSNLSVKKSAIEMRDPSRI